MTLLKADTHQHLEAAGTYDIYKGFADNKGIEIPSDFTPGGFQFTTLPQFFQAYDYINEKLIDHAEEYYHLTRDYLKRMAADHVVYADLMVSPAHGVISGINYTDLMDAIIRAIEEAAEQDGIHATISITTVRGEGEHYGPEHATRWAETIKGFLKLGQHRYITSFGLAGNEHYDEFASFAPAFAIAKDAGLTLRAHAGEGTSAAVIRDAMQKLDISVIDHGYKLTEDEELLKEVADRDMHITVIPTSNDLLSVHDGNAETHPLWKMREAGIALSIGGDDNYFFNTNTGDEYDRIQKAGHLSDADMLEFTKNAIYSPLVPKWMREKILQLHPTLARI